MSRVIKKWAGIYDLASYFIYLLFGGTKRLYLDIISMAEVRDGDRILDIGCGTGELLFAVTKKYSNINGLGIDASQEMVAIANKKAVSRGCSLLDFKISEAEKLPYENQTFDCVFNIFLLHHMPMQSKIECLKEIYRVLKPERNFLLVDVDRPTSFIGRIVAMTRYNVREIRENMQRPLIDLLKEAGFSSMRLMRKDYGIFSFIRCNK